MSSTSSISTVATSTGALAISGLSSGLNWQATVQQLAQAERAPETAWQQQQQKINNTNSAFTIITSYLNQLQSAALALEDPTIFTNAAATSSVSTVATASAAAGAKLGTYNFNIGPLATAASLTGTTNIGQHLSATNDVSGVTVGAANFANPVTAGTFTVNGSQITIATTDSLQSVFNKISSATSGAVTASYDSTTDKITLASANNISLGSAADTSNFLGAAKLYPNGTGSVSSTDTLGRAQTGSVLTNASLATAINDGPNSHVSATNDVSGVTMSSANFGTPVTAGTFTVDGAQVSFAGTNSLQDVFNAISTATGGKVTASYNASTDRITLANSNSSDTTPITLGAPSDTSNFLSAALLSANGSSSVTSSSTVGSGAGAFQINGVTINFNALTDTTQNVLDRINSSAAGVTASYDVVNNKFSIVNNLTGALGISMSDTTGNFLAATGLASGTFNAGTNLTYSVNGGATLTSQSNTIDATSSGISGLSVTALTSGTTSVTVNNDTSAIATQVQNFVTAYNNVQSYITTNAATSKDANGNTVPGTLTGDLNAADLSTSLRSATFSPVSIAGLSTTFSQLASLGLNTNGTDNTVALDTTALNNALTGNLGAIQKLFTDPTNGIAKKLDSFVSGLTGNNGSLVAHQAALTQQSTSITTQIANLEKQITNDTATWTTEFQAMETASAQLNSELTYITKNFS
jgi:flagellar hook-associated protein 2